MLYGLSVLHLDKSGLCVRSEHMPLVTIGTMTNTFVDFLYILLVTPMRDSDITTGSQFACGQSNRRNKKNCLCTWSTILNCSEQTINALSLKQSMKFDYENCTSQMFPTFTRSPHYQTSESLQAAKAMSPNGATVRQRIYFTFVR